MAKNAFALNALFDEAITVAAYVGALAIVAWAILKAAGIIHSPIWVEMIPFIGAGATLLGLVYKAGKVMQEITSIKNDLSLVVRAVGHFDSRMIRVETILQERK